MNVGVALSEVPVNLCPLIDDTDFKTRETGIVYNQAGMDLVWNFTDVNGNTTQTAVTPTTAGNYDWAHQGDGMYTIEIPASGGASINNNQIGFGYFSGICTGVLPWRGPTIEFGVALVHQTTIASRTSQTVFTLTAGSSDNSAYLGWLCVLRDATDGTQIMLGVVSAYTGSTKTVTLEADPAVFTTANGDYVLLLPQPDGLTVQQAADVNTEADTAITDAFTFTGTAVQADIQQVDGAAISQGGASPGSPYGV